VRQARPDWNTDLLERELFMKPLPPKSRVPLAARRQRGTTMIEILVTL